jgi:nucleotide-binding universal stress UspA family protein
MENFNRIIVPTDLSEYSLAAVKSALVVAKYSQAEIFIVNVIEDGESLDILPFEAYETPKQREAIETKRKELITAMLKKSELLGQNTSIYVYHGYPAREIIRAASELNADLIVMSTHGRSGLSHILLGSIAEKVVRYAACAVLTIKPSKYFELVSPSEKPYPR